MSQQQAQNNEQEQWEMDNHFDELSKIDVSSKIEKKGKMSYLSWPFAVSELMKRDPQANWEFHPPVSYDKTVMVSCSVIAFGKTMNMHLPVMDHQNKAVVNPDAFAVNKAMMRCLVKCIAVHGLGLYIYAGEDLPEQDGMRPESIADLLASLDEATDLDDLRKRTTHAMSIAQQGADMKAHEQFKAYAAAIAENKYGVKKKLPEAA